MKKRIIYNAAIVILKFLLVLRKVSRRFRIQVDRHGIRPRHLYICLNRFNLLELHIDGAKFKYINVNGDCVVKKYDRAWMRLRRIAGGDYVEMALNDMIGCLQHSLILLKIHLNHHFNVFMDKLRGRVHTQNVSIRFQNPCNIIAVLQCCEPENIHLAMEKPTDFFTSLTTEMHDQFKIITCTAQWKYAKTFELWGSDVEADQIEHLFHFEKFSIRMLDLSIQNAAKIKDNLLKSSTFKTCVIRFFGYNTIGIAKVFKPDYYTGDFQYDIQYSNENQKFEINCRKAPFNCFDLYIRKC